MSCPVCELTSSCKCHEPERILHAAVKSKDGSLTFFGKCHADCFYKGQAMGVRMSSKAIDQGFLSNKGNYHSRDMAAKIAFEQGQIDKPASFLFSEDLWSPMYNGKYYHDEIKGYVLKGADKPGGEEIEEPLPDSQPTS